MLRGFAGTDSVRKEAMFYMKHQSELEAQYAWTRKGKKYKAKYFAALGQLFGDSSHDKECQPATHTERRSGTDQARHMAHKAGN